MPLWTPTKKTHSYRAEIRVKGKVRERKPK